MIVLRLLRCTRAASAAEFGLVLPILVLMLFGIIDGGRYLWEYNRAEKATQVGARFAVVTNTVEGGLNDHSYVGDNVGGTYLTQGDRIPAGALGSIACTDTACTCASGQCPPIGTYNATAFDNVVARMKDMKPDITAQNVKIEYHSSGLGFAGDPNGMDVSPLVTVSLETLPFRPITTLLLVQVTMPSFATTLSAEDSNGTQSN